MDWPGALSKKSSAHRKNPARVPAPGRQLAMSCPQTERMHRDPDLDPEIRLAFEFDDGRRHSLPHCRPLLIGSGEDCQVQLHDRFISGVHARVRFDTRRGRYQIEDLGSTNGTLVDGVPVNRAVLEADRGRARSRFGIEAGRRCLLVMGGSLGARTINRAAIEAFAERPGRDFEVVHVAGSRDYPELRQRLNEATNGAGYTLLEYEPDMGDGLAACDLVLARSGGSVFELTARGRPSILVPYPHATGDHQTANAEWLAEAGAAEVLADADLTAEVAMAKVGALLGDEARLAAMAAAAQSLARPGAAAAIADEVLSAAGGTQ